MKHLLKYFKGYIPQTLLAPLFKLCEVIFELLVPLIMQQIIDVGIKNADKPYIFKMCGLLVLFGICGLGFALTAQYFAAKSAVGFATGLRSDMFKKINSLSFSQLDYLGNSTIITRMTTDVNQLQNGVNMILRLALRSPFIVFGALFMAFLIDPQSSIVFVITIAVLFAVVFAILLITIPLYKKVQGKLDKVLKRTRENLLGIRVIRAFCLEKSEKSKFEDENSELNKSQIFVGRISALLNPLTYVLINLAIAVLIYVGAIRVNSGLLTQGAVVALYNYMSQILVELVKLANTVILTNKSFASAARINDVLQLPEDDNQYADGSPENASAPAVCFDNVSLNYNNSPEAALQDISFTLNAGETLGIIGSTGSGKTSVAMMIPHFYEATKGVVKIFGKDVKTYNNETLRSFVGIVLQTAALFSGTIRDNIRWGNNDADDEEIIDALKTAQAYEFVAKLDKGLDSPVAQNGKNFSGGQRQRLSVARAIVKKPKILILDDSSSALDYATDLELRRSIKNLPFKPTTIIISQRTASVMSADKILVLDDGKAVGLGTHEQLLENCEVYKEIYNCANK